MALLFRHLHEALDRNSAAFERNAKAFERNADAFERNADAFERNADAFERNADVFDRHEAAFRDFQEAFRQDRFRAERIFREQMAAITDMRDEIRSHTKAINRVLDRWGEGPTPAS